MSGGPPLIHTINPPAAAATFSSSIDIGGSYSYYSVEIPTMTSATDIYIQGSSTDGGTFRRVYFSAATSTPVVMRFPSSVTNGIFPVIGPLPRYIRTEYTSANTGAGNAIKLICHQ